MFEQGFDQAVHCFAVVLEDICRLGILLGDDLFDSLVDLDRSIFRKIAMLSDLAA